MNQWGLRKNHLAPSLVMESVEIIVAAVDNKQDMVGMFIDL